MAIILKRLRKERNITQAQLAHALHVHQTAVSQWECGRTFPDRETIIKLAAFYCVSADVILGIRTETAPPAPAAPAAPIVNA